MLYQPKNMLAGHIKVVGGPQVATPDLWHCWRLSATMTVKRCTTIDRDRTRCIKETYNITKQCILHQLVGENGLRFLFLISLYLLAKKLVTSLCCLHAVNLLLFL